MDKITESDIFSKSTYASVCKEFESLLLHCMLLFVWKAFMIDVSRIDVTSHTVSDVSVPYSWSSVPYTIGLWRKFLCDVIKYGCFERAFLVEDFVVSKMLNLFLNHLVWVKFPLHFVTICVTCIVDFYVLSRASEVGSPTNHLGSRQRRDTGQGSSSPLTSGQS